MAEFTKVMRQKRRLCKATKQCSDCILEYPRNGTDCDCNEILEVYPEKAELIVMAWAAAHPEKKYPTWADAWRQLFPQAQYSGKGHDNAPCLKYFLPKKVIDTMECCRELECDECGNLPISAEIAEKLGVAPVDE